jgi:hypothetical protein
VRRKWGLQPPDLNFPVARMKFFTRYYARKNEVRQSKGRKMNHAERFERLKRLTPLEATRAWLEGDFDLDDEPALIEALRKDKRISLSDDKIIDLFAEAIMEEDVDAQEFLERLERAA